MKADPNVRGYLKRVGLETCNLAQNLTLLTLAIGLFPGLIYYFSKNILPLNVQSLRRETDYHSFLVS